MTQKLFCYVDETGQDTRGKLFIVSVVVTADERDGLRRLCEIIERETGKNRVKWSDAAHVRRLAYIQRILAQPTLRGRLHFALYYDSRDYTSLTVEAITSALNATEISDYEATVLIDALPRSLERAVGLRLRRSGIPAKKVRGVKKDENDALVRLADAVCGFVRTALEQRSSMRSLLEQSLDSGVLKDVSQK